MEEEFEEILNIMRKIEEEKENLEHGIYCRELDNKTK